MRTHGTRRTKVIEWLRRYLPLEICSRVGELGAAALVYQWTGSLATAAIAATVGSSVGYYAPAYVTAMRWCCKGQTQRAWPARLGIANFLALRSLLIEFGPAELIDSLVVRPLLFYVTPMALGNVLLGWVLGGLAADILFYACTIFSYERFGSWLVHRPGLREREEVPDEPHHAVAVG